MSIDSSLEFVLDVIQSNIEEAEESGSHIFAGELKIALKEVENFVKSHQNLAKMARKSDSRDK